MLELWGMQSIPSLSSLPSSPWSREVAPDMVLFIGHIELNCVLLLSWIVWNRYVLTFKLCTYVKLNWMNWNCFCMLNWIVWNRTVFDIETVLMLFWIEIELFICLKIDLLNWIAWNKAVLIFKLRSHAKVSCLKWICFCMLHWIVWNRTFFDIETVFMLN